METETPVKARRTYFIDSENHINTCLQGIESLSEDDLVVVFHRESNLSQKQKESIKDSPARIEWILCQDSGVKNSLDVQLIAELSRRIACHEIENGYIVSQDQGYKPAIHYLLNRYADEFRFLGLKKSIDEFMLADALVSADSRKDVHEALVRTAGQIVGTAMYRNIRNLFDSTSGSDEPEEGYTVEGAPLFPESANEAVQQNGNGVGNGGSQRSKSSKRRKPRSAAKANGNGFAPADGDAAHVEDEQQESAPAEPQRQNARRSAGRSKAPRTAVNDSAASAEAAVQPRPNEAEPTATPESQEAPAQAEQEAKAPRPKRPRRKPAPTPEAAKSAEGSPEQAPVAERKTAAPKPTGAVKAAPQSPVAAEAEAPQRPDEQPAAKPSRRRGRKPAQAKSGVQTPLENLPGIGKALAARLESVGIPTAEALREKGSRASWVLLKKQDPATSINWLYALEGAVLGIAVKELDDETKTALKSFSKLAL